MEIADQEFYSGGSALAKGRELTELLLSRTPDLDFIYYSNDMIGVGGMLHCIDAGLDVPGRIGLAGFNGVELLDGFSRRLATMDACRTEIGRLAAQMIVARAAGEEPEGGRVVELSPTLNAGDTLQRR